ncbi:hypothetical protein JXB02_06350 [Candidatus Woesearchaeota archaeon]|nr:hypothetical protein [Candidatus Woesearchaeota archaeon]
MDVKQKKSSLPPNYYQGTLQLRRPTEEIVVFVERAFAKERRKNPDVFVSKVTKHTSGLDLYVTSNRFLRTLVTRLEKEFGGRVKLSPRLFSKDRQTGKELHRLTALFEPFEFLAGDVINAFGHNYLVAHAGRRVSCVDLSTGKRTSFEGKVFDHRRSYEVLGRHTTTITMLFPAIEVLDPADFQSVRLQNQEYLINQGRKLTVDQTVTVVKKDGLWAV